MVQPRPPHHFPSPHFTNQRMDPTVLKLGMNTNLGKKKKKKTGKYTCRIRQTKTRVPELFLTWILSHEIRSCHFNSLFASPVLASYPPAYPDLFLYVGKSQAPGRKCSSHFSSASHYFGVYIHNLHSPLQYPEVLTYCFHSIAGILFLNIL